MSRWEFYHKKNVFFQFDSGDISAKFQCHQHQMFLSLSFILMTSSSANLSKTIFFIFSRQKNSKNRRRKVGDIRQNFFSDLNSIQRNFFWFHNWLILNGNSDQQMAPFFTIGPRYLYPIVLQQVWTIQVVCRRCRRQSYVAYVAFKLTLPMQDQQIISFFVSDLGARRK